jgi:pyrimidine-nucleoside phosphorylase
MRIVDLIRKKRDGGELSREEVESVVGGYTRGDFPDYQMSAWLMATLLRGMTGAELAALTESMLHSGQVLDFSDLPGKKVDKHSTGGVGDKTSLVLAPLAAAGGLLVPMISGRGLGHTGGTLDKLEAIPGFNVNLTLKQFRDILKSTSCAMIGQTAEIAPADKKIYALRDVTGTVESPYLICASIMSKKLAEGVDALVLDVKTGSGAFMKKEEDAVYLAELMVDTGRRMGKNMVALITNMDQPLGNYVGNALEVVECIHVLNGEGPKDLRDLCLELTAWMFYLGERSQSVDEGRKLAAELIASGAAMKKFREMVRVQGGDERVVDDLKRLPQARSTAKAESPADGYVTAIMTERLGTASLVLGGGREKKEDAVDPAVGLVVHKKIGDRVARGEALCTIYYNSGERLKEAQQLIENSYRIEAKQPASAGPLVRRVIEGGPKTKSQETKSTQ